MKELDQQTAKCAQVEDALKGRQKQPIKNLMDCAQVGIMTIDAETHRLVDVNRAAERMIGATKESIGGKICYDLVCQPEGGKCPITDLGQTVDNSERVLIKSDGSTIPILKTVTSVMLNGRRHLVESFLDITHQREATEALQKSEKRYRELFDHMTSGVAVYETQNKGKDFVFIDLNKAGERISRVKKGDVLGKNVLEVFPGVKDFGLLDVFRQVWATGVSKHPPVILYQDDPITNWCENRVYRLPTGEVVAIYDDVTEKRQAKQALEASEKKFRRLFKNANDAVFVHTLDGQILDVNPNACKMLGYQKGALLAMPVSALHPEECLPDCRKALEETRQKGAVLFDSRFKKADGTLIDVEISAKITDERKGIVQGIARDITKRNRAETALRAKEEELTEESHRLQEVNAALQVLLKKREEDKDLIQENLLFHVRALVFPYLEQLKQGHLGKDQTSCLKILQKNLDNVISPLARKLASRYVDLTPTQVRVADLVREGKSNKEMAELFCVSENTIKTHRFNIRNKLGLKNKKTNLRTYLSSLAQ